MNTSILLKKISLFTVFIFVFVAAQAQIDTLKRPFRPMIFPAALIAYGSTTVGTHGYPSSESVRTWRNTNYPNFHSKVDDVLWATPLMATYGLNLLGIKGKHTLKEQMVLTGISLVTYNAVVQPLKYGIGRLRPDGSEKNSFPSGHTSAAFMAAEILHQEYGQKSVWYSIAGYSAATVTGAMRILNNRHWSSDVIVGAGIGMLSTKLIYWGYGKYRHSKIQKKNFKKKF